MMTKVVARLVVIVRLLIEVVKDLVGRQLAYLGVNDGCRLRLSWRVRSCASFLATLILPLGLHFNGSFDQVRLA